MTHAFAPAAARRFRAGLAALAAVAGLAGCGVAYEDNGYNPDPDLFVSWAGSTNGIYVEDADGSYYLVRADNDAVVSYRTGRELGGISVVGVDIVVSGEGAVGVVRLYTRNDGLRAAEFACDDGSFFDIVEGSGGWTWRCV